ncbi:bifunctional hydroxymethylpyrimidine kinase/phosphomethylpyrimidine kinase [Paraglaciecola aquimarina]|uniref:hydroxymethylpyrimidine kinase n=1 Tax=Paraglaciecola algarum TaxID=3050085 RepID=A0ABS9DBZ1_9ALTE|nr:bifunctional hydroxymethylpyrimidine kinase/phosphomethylpyrimidine kinase [Paraglaciecola sp. G1-23]MCF2949151.1 bifunctional hydroxymethylpyrimidine kinase/phosphomethylpyrimidine kinase [Paraglaciecola sp. G1-23]
MSVNLGAEPLLQQSNNSRPVVWSIAASDSGGGAGIQADNLTIHDLGGHSCNIVTGTTAQNSTVVAGVEATSECMLLAQLNCLANDMPPQAIKIGVLMNVSQVRTIRVWLQNELGKLEAQLGRKIPVIWDPVMLATAGQALTESNLSPSLKDYLKLAKQVSLITPNYQELDFLTQENANQDEQGSWQQKIELLKNSTNTNVLFTGGEQADKIATDWLAATKLEHTSLHHQQQLIGFCTNKIVTANNHGTGCTLSSAIASAMALGHPMLDAICIAKAYVTQGLVKGYQIGQGPGVLARDGWPNKLEYFPKIEMPRYPKLALQHKVSFAKVKTPLQIYPVTQSLKVLEQVLKAGALTVQLRIKQPKDISLLEEDIQQAIGLGRKYQAQVFINDHWQLAIKHGAFGVHLGQEDVLEVDLEQISLAGLALGLSSHGYFEMLLIQQLSPSYLAIGHIFPTPTKSMPSQPQGLQKLARYCQLLKGKIPLVAIGGIEQQNLAQIAQTNVDDVAVVRAVEQAENPGLSWKNLQHQWEACS